MRSILIAVAMAITVIASTPTAYAEISNPMITEEAAVCDPVNSVEAVRKTADEAGIVYLVYDKEDSEKIVTQLVLMYGTMPFVADTVWFFYLERTDAYALGFFSKDCMVHFSVVNGEDMKALIKNAIGREYNAKKEAKDGKRDQVGN